jgi:hypothetical protein
VALAVVIVKGSIGRGWAVGVTLGHAHGDCHDAAAARGLSAYSSTPTSPHDPKQDPKHAYAPRA